MMQRKRLAAVCVSLMLMTGLLLPGPAAAGSPWQQGSIWVPADLAEPLTLTVGEVSVTVRPGSIPEGGLVRLRVLSEPGYLQADLLPSQEFAEPVLIDMGRLSVVTYRHGANTETIVTEDLDGNGEPGEFESDHFSRYSGWY